MLLKSKKRLTAYVLAALCVASTGFAATEHWNDASTMPKTIVATQAGDANWEQWKTSWEVTANCPNGLLFGTVCEPGMSVVVIASKTGSLSSYTVYSYDRMTAVAGFLAFFALLLMVVGGKKGVKSVIALTETSASSSSPASSSRASARCSTSPWTSRPPSRRSTATIQSIRPRRSSRAACASARMSWARWPPR